MNPTGFSEPGAPPRWLGHPAVGPAEISVLMCLLMHADRRGVCWVGQTRIGATYKRSRAWANAALRGLERAGIVAIERRRGANGRDETCLYRLMGPGGSAWTCRPPRATMLRRKRVAVRWTSVRGRTLL